MPLTAEEKQKIRAYSLRVLRGIIDEADIQDWEWSVSDVFRIFISSHAFDDLGTLRSAFSRVASRQAVRVSGDGGSVRLKRA